MTAARLLTNAACWICLAGVSLGGCGKTSSAGPRAEGLPDAAAPGSTRSDASDASQPPRAAELCGSSGEPCCGEPLPACGTGLRCGDSSGRCELLARDAGASELCRNDQDCAPGETCCPAGAFGTCETLARAACPLPDLITAAPVATGVYSYIQEFYASSCELEWGCVRAPGKRRMISFEQFTANIGSADLILGDPASSPKYQDSACGLRHLQNYVRFELVTASGSVAAVGSAGPSCTYVDPYLPASLPATRFGCDFLGLERGFSAADVRGNVDCPIDLTDLAPGAYTLRTTINPEHTLPESNYENNRVEVRLNLPVFDAPLQACPEPASNGQFPLGYSTSADRECGWRSVPSSPPASCAPGSLVTIGCLGCTGGPMLRACEGTEPCTATAALTLGDSYASDAIGNYCPLESFPCPASGSYSVWVAAQDAYYNPVFSCVPSLQDPNNPTPPPEVGDAGLSP